jgi:SAM-dependent methyltransferase
MLSIDARQGASAVWSHTPCGSGGADEGSPAYFAEVERNRYAQQSWMHDYFRFEQFRGKSVLEIGVGQGTDLAQFAKYGAQCFGIDITERHLALAERNLASRGFSADLRRADATHLPFPDATFDCVYSFGVMHHIPEIDQVVAEVHRVLKPGGTFFVSVYHLWSKDSLALFVRQGLLGRKLWSLGVDGLLSLIEEGADGVDRKPYVRLYSRRSLRAVLGAFQVRDLSVFQLHVARLPRALARPVEALARLFGWYVVATATKRDPSVP